MIRFTTYLFIYILTIAFSFSQVTTEEVLVKNDGIQLPGTLSLTKEKTPLIIWIHGSGGVDRNGNQPEYIKQFREAVNKQNIAFFSYDKRTANKNNIVFLKQGVLFNDFVLDAKKVVNHFKNDKRFTKIILVGHSQGSLVAMLALKNVEKYISIAGAGETIDKTLIKQVTKQNEYFGGLTEKYLKELKETGQVKNVDPNLMSLFASQNQPFLSSWIALNPLEEIKKVKIPTLIINGNKDLQVQVTDAENLKKSKSDASLVIIDNMNHVLKHINKNTDNMKSYFSADFPLSEKLIETVVSFVKK
ncbi:alpha/beta hydrolase [Tenacibaculum soleae]|uniref:alpha/beta hydrolase family protein n=1 Tax=Tenacibaculum soleae TaxID=447689 RepID=UPI0026E468A3|nr:alpha/beta hydrolase [Tenacibaculum soleae]MDO6743569.1 alpha/beta hydrolase [Tenacibaculum soleae]